jgi:hypothetical protein
VALFDQFAQDAGELLTVTDEGAVRFGRASADGISGNAPPANTLRGGLHFVHDPPRHLSTPPLM